MITDLNVIVKEWAYRVHDGKPNPNNSAHLYHLSEILIENKWPLSVIDVLLQNLNEVDIVQKKQADGSYGSPYTVKQHNPDKGQKLVKKNASPEDIKKVDKGEDTQDVPKEIEKIFNGQQNSVKDAELYMNDTDKKLVEEFKNDFIKLTQLKGSNAKKLAVQMIEKYGLEASSGKKPKVYIRNINFEARKYLGQNKATEFIKDTLEKSLGTSLKGTTKGANVKQEVMTTSKPNLETKRSSKQDKGVAKFFNRPPYDRLDSNFHQMFGPVDNTGNIKLPSSKHSRAYLEQSIRENNSIRNTIGKLKELEKTENVSPKIRQALEEHQVNIERITKEYDIPSSEAVQAIGDSYAKMAETMNTESPTLAGAMMKNMAEMALYDTELAAGDEVYLPSHGSFPSGDKLKVTRDGNKVERVASVSVKYGRKGKYGAFGFPGETGQYQKYHPDPEYRDRLHSRPGDDGANLGVKDDIIRSDDKMDKILEESGLSGAIKDKEKLYSIIRQNLDEMDELKKEIGFIQNAAAARREGKPPAWKQLNQVKDRIIEMEKRLAEQVKEVIDEDELRKLVGNDNTTLMMGRPGCMVTALTFASTLKTSNGLDVIEHNHQEIKDGKYESHTDTAEDGTNDLKLWKMSWRAYDHRGGGLIASFNSDRKEL